MHRTLISACLLAGALHAAPAGAASAASVTVQDPYLELRSGPGRGFPVTQVVDRGASVDLLRQRTDWIKVRTDRDHEGWVNRRQLERTLTGDGEQVRLAGPTAEARTEHRWEASIGAGDLNGADVVTVAVSYALNDSLYLRADFSQLFGEFSNGWLVAAGIGHIFVPQRRVSPFVGIGAGWVYVEPTATLVEAPSRSNQAAYGAAGLRGYFNNRFLLQAEYRQYLIFMDTNENEVINAWTVGFTHFF
jgi:hypothetical protein